MIQLDTLGAVGLRRQGTDVRSVLSQPKRLALLAYLATGFPGGFEARERLLALFWPESDEERARNALRQALHYLRRSLGPETLVGPSEREIGVDAALVACDAVAFERAVAAGRHMEAVELYRGDFLQGLHVDDAPDVERWIDERRARYRRMAVEAARAAADAEEARGDTRSATLLVRQALAVDPLDEVSLRRLLGLLDRGGERGAALEAWAAFARRYREELGLDPSPETLEAAERLREPAARAVEPTPRPVSTPSPAAPVAPPATDPPRPGRWRASARSAAMAAAVLAGLAVVALLVPRPAPPVHPGGGDTPPAIAVLPFMNLSGDPGQEFFSDGMAEEVMAALARVPGLRVVARTSAFSFKGSPAGIDSIARVLRVGHVLEGSVRMRGRALRVTAKLVDATTGYQVWTDTYDGELSDAFEVQDAIARDIVRALEPRLLSSTPERQAETADPDAYADVLRGLAALRLDRPQAFETADSAFRRAVTRDPGYGRAWAGLARIRVVDVYRRKLPPGPGYAEARALAERALALSPTDASAHVVLGRIAEDRDWDFAAAEHHYRQALELAPSDDLATLQLSRLLAHLGRADESIALAERTVDLDPLAPVAHRWLGTSLMLSGRHERAVGPLRRALALGPEAEVARSVLGVTLAALGRHDEAFELLDDIVTRLPDEHQFLAHGGWAAARAGDFARARRLLARIEASADPAHYYRALVLAGLGEVDAALDALDRAVAAREAYLPQVASHPAFDGLHADPRFREILGRVGLEPRG